MNSMTIPDEAVEAALWAWIESAAEGVTHENVSPLVLDRNRPRAAAALEAAMSHLHHQIPNTVEALEALPDGAIIRGEFPFGGADVWVKWQDDWLLSGGVALSDASYLAEVWRVITEWTVLWPLGGAS